MTIQELEKILDSNNFEKNRVESTLIMCNNDKQAALTKLVSVYNNMLDTPDSVAVQTLFTNKFQILN